MSAIGLHTACSGKCGLLPRSLFATQDSRHILSTYSSVGFDPWMARCIPVRYGATGVGHQQPGELKDDAGQHAKPATCISFTVL